MAIPVRFPITNRITGNNFTVTLAVGSGAAEIDVLLDTGSSMLTVDGALYDAGADRAATTTQLLQTAQFSSGTLMAAVVRTPVGLLTDGDPTAITVPKANLAVVYNITPNLFGRADGILGLAYPALNKSYLMPKNTWGAGYKANQLAQGQPAANLDPYLNQVVAAGLAADKFAFAIQRSVMSEAADGAAADLLNAGVFVIGGGADCTDLYTGPFASVAVVQAGYYNTNLVAVQVGDRTVAVAPTPAGGAVASNSVVDSGNSSLMLDPGLYRQVIGLFNAINPIFGTALGTSGSYDQTALILEAWPALRFVLQGAGGGQAIVTVAPQDYWQFDSDGPGRATTGLTGGSPHPGQSILGLPLFAGHYVVFDRTAAGGRGSINFAARRTATPATPIA